jgi:hypothetical protein
MSAWLTKPLPHVVKYTFQMQMGELGVQALPSWVLNRRRSYPNP